MNDDRIIELFWNRDESTVSALSEKYGKYLAAVSRKLYGFQAESELTILRKESLKMKINKIMAVIAAALIFSGCSGRRSVLDKKYNRKQQNRR